MTVAILCAVLVIVAGAFDLCLCRIAAMANEAPECVTCKHIFECKVLHSDGCCLNYERREE